MAAESLNDVADFAVEWTAALLGVPCAALMQLEGKALLPIAASGWPGPMRAAMEADRVRVSSSLASRAGVEALSLLAAEVQVRGRPWAMLAVHAESGTVAHPEDAHRLGAVTFLLTSLREREMAEREREYLATHDVLTGLPNRTIVVDRLQELAGASPDAGLAAVVCIDVDNFFEVNDTVGLDAADGLLRDVAARLERAARTGDTAARQTGDRFLVLCEGLSSEIAARAEADRLRRAVSGAVRVGSHDLVMSASAGVALASPETAPGDLLWKAELAMFEAKEAGRSRVALFEPSFHDRFASRRHVEVDLRRALNDSDFVLHYQPLVRLGPEKMISAEGLIRWQHRERGLIPPGEFIPIAEETNLVIPLGEWVLNTACAQAKQWHDVAAAAGVAPPGVSVNLSARQVCEPALAQRVSAALSNAHLPADQLTLEITETVIMTDSERSAGALRELKDLGVRLSIDDFGTGYSSLSYLKKFPVDTLKIDRSFVDGLGTDLDDSVIVGGIVGLADALGMSTVAEGVETRLQADELARLGCRVAQGFLFARPEPHDDLCDRIRTGS